MVLKAYWLQHGARHDTIAEAKSCCLCDLPEIDYPVAPVSLYGVNNELNFVPQVSQYLYLEYSSVTDEHWSVQKGEN